MSVNTYILLPNEARPEDVLLVLGILCGKKATMQPLGESSEHVVVEGVSLQAAPNQFGCGRMVVDGICSLFCIANSQNGQRGDYAVKTGFWIPCPCNDYYQRLGVELVRFFGGEVDFNDCDSTDVDFAWSTAPDLMAVNGQAWNDLQKRIFAVKPIKRGKGEPA